MLLGVFECCGAALPHDISIWPRSQSFTFAMAERAFERLRYLHSSNEAVASAPAVVSAAVAVRVVILSSFDSQICISISK